MRPAYLQLPRFPVQRRVREQPSLAGRPVLLHADERGVQRVRFASGAALRRGVRPQMTVAESQALVPEVVRLPFVPAAEAGALASLGETLLALAPGYQVDPPEGLWLDASAAHLCGGEAKWAQRVLDAAHAAGLEGRCVVAWERFTAQALAKWSGVRLAVVEPRGGAELARLPLAALEHGWLGDDAAAPFRALGLSTLAEVAALPPGALVARFGAMGLVAARLSRGEDDSLFVADALPEVFEESVELDWPAEHLEPLLFAVKTVVDRLCGRLQGRQQAAVRLSVTLVLEIGAPMVVPLLLARPTAQGKLLVELLRHRLTDLTVEQPISALSARVEEACAESGRQLVLGDAPAGEAELEVVLSRLQSALGADALFCAQPQARHRPEEGWQQRAFHPPDPDSLSLRERGEGGGEGQVDRSDGSPLLASFAGYEGSGLPLPPKKRTTAKEEPRPEVSAQTMATRPPRLFREPTLLHAEVTGEGALRAVNLLGRRRRVESLWGPERLVGDWWANESFARDYFRVQLEGVGLLWVFRDGRDGQFYAQGVFD